MYLFCFSPRIVNKIIIQNEGTQKVLSRKKLASFQRIQSFIFNIILSLAQIGKYGKYYASFGGEGSGISRSTGVSFDVGKPQLR